MIMLDAPLTLGDSDRARSLCKQGQRKKGNPERFTLLINRVPLGKFNKVNPEPVNAYYISLTSVSVCVRLWLIIHSPSPMSYVP